MNTTSSSPTLAPWWAGALSGLLAAAAGVAVGTGVAAVLQGVRPAGLQKVTNQELADFVNLCISARDQRPRSRMLLKHAYFDSIRPIGQLASKSQVRPSPPCLCMYVYVCSKVPRP